MECNLEFREPWAEKVGGVYVNIEKDGTAWFSSNSFVNNILGQNYAYVTPRESRGVIKKEWSYLRKSKNGRIAILSNETWLLNLVGIRDLFFKMDATPDGIEAQRLRSLLKAVNEKWEDGLNGADVDEAVDWITTSHSSSNKMPASLELASAE